MQSAFIGAETNKKDAQAYAESVIPKAQAEADASVQTARGTQLQIWQSPEAMPRPFGLLIGNIVPILVVVRERLYRDAVDRAIGSAGKVRWVPPPVGGATTVSVSPLAIWWRSLNHQRRQRPETGVRKK